MEYELALIRPDELFLKSDPVMRKMMKQLAHNIRVALKDNDIVFDSIEKQRLGILIRSPEVNEIIKICKYLPGISVLMPAAVVGGSMKTIQEVSLDLAKQAKLTKSKSFAVRAKRSDKSFKYDSRKIGEKVGEYIRINTKAKVNLTKPSITVYVEVLEANKVLISTEKLSGVGGLPVGVSGKVVCLMTEKNEDFIAAYLFLRRGCEIMLLHFRKDDKSQQRYLNKLKKLDKFAYGSKIKTTNVKGGISMSLASKLASHVGAKSLCIGPIKLKQKHLDWMTKAKLPLFTPLVGLDSKKLELFKTLIFK